MTIQEVYLYVYVNLYTALEMKLDMTLWDSYIVTFYLTN